MEASDVFEDIVIELTKVLQNQLTGIDSQGILNYARPNRAFPVGNLSPKIDKVLDIGNDPSSCGFSFNTRIPAPNQPFIIKIKGHYYVRRRPSFMEQIEYLKALWNQETEEVYSKLENNPKVSLPYCWEIIKFEEQFSLYPNSDLSVDLTSIMADCWKECDLRTVPINTKASRGLNEANGIRWKCESDYQNWLDKEFDSDSPNPMDDKTHQLEIKAKWNDEVVDINAINVSTKPDNPKVSWFNVNQHIFAVRFEVDLIDPINIATEESIIEDSFKSISRIKTLGESRNLQLRIEENILHAEPFGVLNFNRVEPIKNMGDADLSFETLTKNPIKQVELVLEYLSHFRFKYAELNEKLSSKQSSESFEKINSIIARFRDGLELLKNDTAMLKAFIQMNETFNRRYSKDNNIKSWRGFQFVYIICKLNHIINPDDSFDVIFVSTGGGKTETYFGFLITTMFYLRNTGVNEGTIAIVKFPLRMLALDQIQRAAPLIAIADMIRKEQILGYDDMPQWYGEFSLGFMIGGSSGKTSTPNRVNNYRNKIENLNGENDTQEDDYDLHYLLNNKPQELKVLFECPICRYLDKEDEGDYDTVEILYDEAEVRAKHFCSKCDTRFAIHWTDEECFRYLPTLIISTQDRVAYSAFAPHSRGIYGAPLYYCPFHGYSIYSNSCTPFKHEGGYGKLDRKCDYLKQNVLLPEVGTDPSSRALRFVIQDEMHLLKSDLGAIDSPFEIMVSETVNYYAGRKIQYIGMSATVQGVQKQIEELYGGDKIPWIFPGDPPNDNFVNPPIYDAFFSYSKKIHRVFLGCMPSSEPSSIVSQSFDITTRTIYDWEGYVSDNWEMLPTTLKKYEPSVLRNAFGYYRVNLGFMKTKVDLERTKQNLENLTNVERTKRRRLHGHGYNDLFVDELTGDNSITDIRKIMSKIKKMANNVEERVDILLATNLVSHGVDLKEMNFMTFFGIPNSNSEYIQALSRVGRVYPGVVMIVYHPNRARDRGLWKTFNSHHQGLRQQVEVMPVDHRAPGIVKQTLVTLLRSYFNLIGETRFSIDKQCLYKLVQIATKYDEDGADLVDSATSEICKWLRIPQEESIEIYHMIEDYMYVLNKYYQMLKGNRKNAKDIHSPPPTSSSELFRVLRTDVHTWMSTMTGIRGIQPSMAYRFDSFSNIYLNSRGLDV